MNRTRRTRLVVTLLTLIFLVMGGANFILRNFIYTETTDDCAWVDGKDGVTIVEVSPGGLADRAGIRVGDILVEIDGKAVVNAVRAQVYIEGIPRWRNARYTIRRGNRLLSIDVGLKKDLNSMSMLYAVIGLVFLATGFMVIIFNPLKRLSRYFFYLCLVTFLFLVFSVISIQPRVFFYFTTGIHTLAGILWATVILHFFLIFPYRKKIVVDHPRLFYLIYLPPFLINLAALFLNAPANVFIYMEVVYLGLAIYSFLVSYLGVTEKKEKRALSIVLWGMLLGMIPLMSILLFTNFLLPFIGSTGLFIALGMMSLLPISFGYAVMKYGLMDVGIVIKRGIVYSITTGFFIVLYMTLVVGTGDVLAAGLGIKSDFLNVFFIALVALALNPVKERIQQFVDKRFFRQKYDYHKMLLALSRDLPTRIKLDEILAKISETLKNAVHVEEVVISAFESEKKVFRIYNRTGVPESCECDFLEYSSGLSQLLIKRKGCVTFYKAEDDPELSELIGDNLEEIRNAGLVLAVPMFWRDRLNGMILLGPKMSGDIYTREDMDILLTVAGQTAVAVENARLHLYELQRQKVEKELEIARRIQQDLLPKEAPLVKGLEIAGCSFPAAEVGGDYFDYIVQSDRRLLVFVGDVSGKGMPAAIYMSKVQGMVQMAGGLFQSPRDILVEVNRKIACGIDKKVFITMLAVGFDMEKRQATIARAGHTPLFVKKNENDPAEVILPRGLGLGISAGLDFEDKIEEISIPILSNECFVLFSDGLTEAMNPRHELFGRERLRELLDRNFQLPSKDLRNLLVSHARSFRETEEQNDDITVVIVKVN